jgi:adenosine deaminase
VCGITSVYQNRQRRHRRIREMYEAGLPLTLNTDDPAMFHTDLTHTYQVVLQGCDWGWQEACMLSLAGVDACWLEAGAKRALRERFEQEIALLTQEHRALAQPSATPTTC